MKRRPQSDYFVPAVLVIFFFALIASVFSSSAPEVEIIDTSWEGDGDNVSVESEVRNNSEGDLWIVIEFQADRYLPRQFDRTLIFVGSAKAAHKVPARSTSTVSVNIPIIQKARGTIQVSSSIRKVSETPLRSRDGTD